MSSALDMSLDDIIKNNKKSSSTTTSSNPRFRGRFTAAGPGPTRRINNRSANRPTPYAAVSKAPDSMWKHDMFAALVQGARAFPAPAGARTSAIETGTKLYISNLDYGVSNEDIKELFSEVGDLKRYSINYDRSGRSKGTAEIVYSRRQDGLAAVKRYNNVQLDGKPMKIEIVGTNIPAPPALPPVPRARLENFNADLRSFPGRGGSNGSSRGGGRGMGRGRGRGRGRAEPVSAADLDAELDKYHSESMQIN